MSMNPRTLRPSSTFSPRSISGLALWLDASDSSTLTITDDVVSQWNDKSISKVNATQTTPENRPGTTIVNGRTAVLFDGANDGLIFTGTARTDQTWILVAAQTEDQTGSRSIITDAANGYGITPARIGANRGISSGWGSFGATTYQVVNLGFAGGLPASVLSVNVAGGIGGNLWRNGIAIATFTDSLPTTISRIGFLNSSTFPLTGWIGEILCYSRSLNPAERQKAERYLGTKFGVTVA